MSDDPEAKPRDIPIRGLASWLGEPVSPARFPRHILRWKAEDLADRIGLGAMDEADWVAHFGRYEPLPDNLDPPLALKYHGHQFRVYNPDIGDGRGFLFAQMRDIDGRLLDLGTKGSGQTPFSRQGDGRLTLQGAVRELLASEMLFALGVDTSRTFAIVETGEQLIRGDEPSPTRSATLTRLSHGHIRIGTFQRLLAVNERDNMATLVDYCLKQFPGPPAPSDAPDRENPAVVLMHQVVERMADLAASYIVAGFVHGVLNTDNMNITGESFDYGPWRFLAKWDATFTAAYFDHAGLYAFGRQPEALNWNCAQLAVSLRLLAEAPGLIAALDRFGPLYQASVGRRWCWRLGLEAADDEANGKLVAASEKLMRSEGIGPDEFFHRHRFGIGGSDEFAGIAHSFRRRDDCRDPGSDEPPSLIHQNVETIWRAIAENDDWQPMRDMVGAIRTHGDALGPPPVPVGHIVAADRK